MILAMALAYGTKVITIMMYIFPVNMETKTIRLFTFHHLFNNLSEKLHKKLRMNNRSMMQILLTRGKQFYLLRCKLQTTVPQGNIL